MSLAGRVLLRGRQSVEELPSHWRLLRFRMERSKRKCLQLGPRVRFNVPVRSNGAGTLVIGSDNMFGYRPAPCVGDGCILLQPRFPDARICIGDHNAFSNNVAIIAAQSIVIGNHCLVGDQVIIFDCDFHDVDPALRHRSMGQIKPVSIGNNVWLGSRVMVLKGVMIGDNSVVAAMSVVVADVPANCVVAGNPAKFIRSVC